MLASVNTKYGSPDVLELKEVDKPVPGKKEVLVKVVATTVNRTDCATLRAKPFFARIVTGLFKPKKTTLGTEFAGIIEALGEEVPSFHIGDKVFGFNDGGLYAHAEYLTISTDNTFANMPDDITFEQAAASLEGAHYALNFLNKVELESGQKVLVNGATGAIGSAMVQLLKYYGLEISAVCGTKNIDLVKSMGAGRVFDYEKEDFTNSDEKYKYVFDAVGKSTFFKCKHLLEENGIYISSELGPYSQNVFLPITTSLTGKKKVKFPFPVDRMKTIQLIKKLISEGRFKTVIDRTYPLEKIKEAFKYVESGKKIGNVVIQVTKE